VQCEEKSWKGREQGAIANPVIKPKSSGVATPKLHGGDGAITGELVVYEPCKEAVRPVTINIWVHPLHPNFPGRGARGEELVHKFHEQTVILTFKILDPEAPFDKWVADTVPRHQAPEQRSSPVQRKARRRLSNISRTVVGSLREHI